MAIGGHPDGTPAGCHVLRETGHELGDSVAVNGVRWTKAPGFRVGALPPLVGDRYPQGTRFCLDQDALLTEVLEA